MPITTSGTLTQEFVEQLSSELLLEPDAECVFALLANAARAGALGIAEMVAQQAAGNMQQAMGGALGTLKLLDQRWMQVARDFAKVVSEPTTPGKVILIDRPQFLSAGTMTEASRVLTEGTRITANPQAVTMGQVSVTIKQYAGPHDGTAVAPIGITSFLKGRAKHNLVEYVGTLLRRDRNQWVDRVISALLLSTTNVTTADGTAEGALTAGKKMTEDTLSEIEYQLEKRNIPPFANGMWMLVFSPEHKKDLRADTKFRESVRYLGAEGALVNGHLTNHGRLMLVESTNIPTKGVGSGGAVTGFQGVAFGPSCIGWAIGSDAKAARSQDDDFGREDRVIWIADEGWQLLDARFVQRVVTT